MSGFLKRPGVHGLGALLVVSVLVPLPAAAGPGLFSSTGLEGWMEHRFAERLDVRYRLKRSAGIRVLEADCKMGASGWHWDEEIDLASTPVLRWRWSVTRLPEGPSERTREGDDFAARVYAVVRTGLGPWDVRSVVYVWAREQPAGTDWPSGYTEKAHNVALRSGAADAGLWREERRDLRADFRRYFGIDAQIVESVALMTDCDDGGGRARAAYGDIRVEGAAPGSGAE